MKNYYLGSWVFRDGAFRPPVGAVGCLDFAPLTVQSSPASDRPVGLFVTTAAILPSEYTLLGTGDCRELKADTRMQDAFRSLVGYRAKGETLADLIYDALTDGSDPDGSSGPKPLMPGVDGWCDVYLGGHSRILGAKFEWGKPCSRGRSHWAKVQQLLRKEFERLFDDAQAGKLKDSEHHRRVLDAYCDKYKVDDWNEFVPAKLQKDVPGRLKHETTITENFDGSDGDTIGNLLTWTEVSGDFDRVSNKATLTTNDGTERDARAESDLSSDDHYAQAVVDNSNSGERAMGPCCRFAGAARTYYYTYFYANKIWTYKKVNNVVTNLANIAITAAQPELCKVSADGSTVKGYQAGVERTSNTDTAITGNVRTGIFAYRSAVSSPTIDDFEAADISAGGGILYTQLERGVRGYLRGVYSGST